MQEITGNGTTSARLPGCWATYAGAAHGVLSAAGMIDLTLRETFGMTGVAFQLFMHKHCFASSVTVYDWVGRHINALDRIGVLSEMYHYEPQTNTYDAARERVICKIKQSIDRGVAVIAWAIDTGEFGIIYGYDDEDGVFLVDGVHKFNRPLGSDPMLYGNLGLKFPPAPFIHVQIPIARIDYDREQTYRNSLRFYLDVMKTQYHMSPDFHCGFRAYDAWIDTLESGTFDAFGLRYNTSVYTECKCYAAEYVRDLAERSTSMRGLTAVADLFGEVVERYRRMQDVLEQDIKDGHHLGKPVTKSQAKACFVEVREAKRLEIEAVDSIIRVLA
ncbi:MAG: hypothetical protein J7639_21340 [Paenibacillaceae bacterium]|nr:hypothetical protein [Paenibacillaceae bacterium]